MKVGGLPRTRPSMRRAKEPWDRREGRTRQGWRPRPAAVRVHQGAAGSLAEAPEIERMGG